jgi:hypothetical protein
LLLLISWLLVLLPGRFELLGLLVLLLLLLLRLQAAVLLMTQTTLLLLLLLLRLLLPLLRQPTLLCGLPLLLLEC